MTTKARYVLDGIPVLQLSGSSYVACNYRDEPNVGRDSDGNPVPIAKHHAIRQVLLAGGGTANPASCDHGSRICTAPECIETWMIDYVFYWDRTGGGRKIRDEAPFDVMAHERAVHRAYAAGTANHVMVRPAPR